jgi:Zn-dependent protease with chaperone function
MNFFEAQERARVASRWLVVWFLLALMAVVASLYAVAVVIKSMLPSLLEIEGGGMQWRDAALATYVVPTAAAVILLGSFYKLMALSAGGGVVARDLGGRPVDPSTGDLGERRLVNVVEEMSIASGVPVPGIWVMDGEDGINAFAAGTDPTNAVIGVTRGCLERLNREELQGVVAHEFSHILNGDMKLNMRLTGWVFGLVMIAVLGRGMLQLLRHVRGSGNDSKGAGVVLLIAVAGAALWLIGSVGALAARFIQAGVSRQREYLADASAVQFTRNPSALADALKKVGGFWRRGGIQASSAVEVRHLFFASSDLLELGFATHPPLVKRIRLLEPEWNGTMKVRERDDLPSRDPADEEPLRRLVAANAAFALDSLGESGRLDPEVGTAIRRNLRAGKVVFHSKDEAKALLAGLLLAQDGEGHERALAVLKKGSGVALAAAAAAWHEVLGGRSAAEKLALVDLSLPWLRRMGREEARSFIALNRELISADGEMNLFEFMLERVIERHVAVGLGLRPVARTRFRDLAELGAETAVLLGAFGGQSGDATAVSRAVEEYAQHTGRTLVVPAASGCTLDQVGDALARMEMSTPLVKSRILRLCGLVVTADGALNDGEVELLRAVADAIGAPVPPLARLA